MRERLKAIMIEEFGTVYDLMVLHEIDMQHGGVCTLR